MSMLDRLREIASEQSTEEQMSTIIEAVVLIRVMSETIAKRIIPDEADVQPCDVIEAILEAHKQGELV